MAKGPHRNRRKSGKHQDSSGKKEGHRSKKDQNPNKQQGRKPPILKRIRDTRKTEPPRAAQGLPDRLRLNRYIALSGVCSRREADTLIAQGKIQVNGKKVTELGSQVLLTDQVTYQGKTLNPEKKQYVLLNKPKDFITTVSDPDDRKTVMELIKNACDERIYPVGRLDRMTTGLLLFTNDGDLADKLMHPSGKVKKIYQVEIDKPITAEHVEQIAAGLELEDGKALVDKIAVVSPDKKVLGLELHIGKNRIVRRIFEQLGYQVLKLDRVLYAGLTKKDLPRGKWRFLKEKEVIRLKHLL